jgi:hypothetical protein
MFGCFESVAGERNAIYGCTYAQVHPGFMRSGVVGSPWGCTIDHLLCGQGYADLTLHLIHEAFLVAGRSMIH